ncbi:MFS transporter [Akkermansiaceae bacterium]|nr:MFS transporter [Akkermansiaceae bacterium]
MFIFVLMISYTIMKPVRDALPSDWGDVSLARQWTFTFLMSTVAVSFYNWAASRMTLNRLVPRVFIFFALSFISLFAAYKLGINPHKLGKIYYVWVSVFSIFHISIFWNFISQNYSKSESKRIFGFINTGASVGAICGPLISALLAKHMNVENILLITSFVLLLVLPLIKMLNAHFASLPVKNEPVELNSNPFSGFQEFIASKQLWGIACFIFFFTGIGALFYYFQVDALNDFEIEDRQRMLAWIEFATNSLTIIIGIFATNRLSRKFGMPTTLASVPLLVAGLLVLLSANTEVIFVLVLQVMRRAGNYAITRPAREILFTAISRDIRSKTKPIIDVMIYRGGDVFWIWVMALLGDGWLKLGLSKILLIGAGIAVVWGLIGIIIGKKYEKDAKLIKENDPSKVE